MHSSNLAFSSWNTSSHFTHSQGWSSSSVSLSPSSTWNLLGDNRTGADSDLVLEYFFTWCDLSLPLVNLLSFFLSLLFSWSLTFSSMSFLDPPAISFKSPKQTCSLLWLFVKPNNAIYDEHISLPMIKADNVSASSIWSHKYIEHPIHCIYESLLYLFNHQYC